MGKLRAMPGHEKLRILPHSPLFSVFLEPLFLGRNRCRGPEQQF
jgi:hypothetical protein